MAFDVDADCGVVVSIDQAMQEQVEEMLNPEAIQKRCRCRVIKHPECCRLCRINNDCARIPVHWNCRCRPLIEC